jgi:hypothetical protein
MSVFRPAFRAIAQSLSDLDLIFVEEAFERLMLDYDRVFSAIHTPACLWRRTGEIYKGNKEMSNLTGIPSQCFRGGNLGIFQLMDEESIVKYYQVSEGSREPVRFVLLIRQTFTAVLLQLFGSIAFDISKQPPHGRTWPLLSFILSYRHQERQYSLHPSYSSTPHSDIQR